MSTQLRRLIEAATPGPWWADVPGFGTIFRGTSYDDSRDDDAWLYDPRYATQADAALIVALRNHAEDIAALIEAAQLVHADVHRDPTICGCELADALAPFEEADRALREAAS